MYVCEIKNDMKLYRSNITVIKLNLFDNKTRKYMSTEHIQQDIHYSAIERLGKTRWDLRKNTLWRKTDLKFQGRGQTCHK